MRAPEPSTVSPEDWRNRERWDAYEAAVHEMVERTSSANAPWTLVPADNKRYARLMVLETVCEALEEGLEGYGEEAEQSQLT